MGQDLSHSVLPKYSMVQRLDQLIFFNIQQLCPLKQAWAWSLLVNQHTSDYDYKCNTIMIIIVTPSWNTSTVKLCKWYMLIPKNQLKKNKKN